MRGQATPSDLVSVAASTTQPRADPPEMLHGRPSHRYIGSVVYGGLDGIITTFAVVSGVAGAALGASVILANLLADGLSMVVGAYLAFRSEQEYIEREREVWQIEHRPAAERMILFTIYRADGFGAVDAGRLAATVARNPQRWVQTMLVEEPGILPNDRNPLVIALVTFGSFVVAVVVPLLVYLSGLVVPIAPTVAFGIALTMSAVALLVLGAAKVFVIEFNCGGGAAFRCCLSAAWRQPSRLWSGVDGAVHGVAAPRRDRGAVGCASAPYSARSMPVCTCSRRRREERQHVGSPVRDRHPVAVITVAWSSGEPQPQP